MSRDCAQYLNQQRQYAWEQREKHKGGTSIDLLDLPKQITNRLRYIGLDTVEELIAYTIRDLISIKGLGPKKAQQIETALSKIHRELETGSQIVLEPPLTQACIDRLQEAGITTYEQLMMKNKEELLKLRGIGMKRVEAIQHIVSRKNKKM